MEQLKLRHEQEIAKLSNKEVEKTKKAAKLVKEWNDEKKETIQKSLSKIDVVVAKKKN